MFNLLLPLVVNMFQVEYEVELDRWLYWRIYTLLACNNKYVISRTSFVPLRGMQYLQISTSTTIISMTYILQYAECSIPTDRRQQDNLWRGELWTDGRGEGGPSCFSSFFHDCFPSYLLKENEDIFWFVSFQISSNSVFVVIGWR
jgi:hypothetical protein